MNIPIILGTAREGRQSEKAANFMLREVIKAGITSEIIDVRDFRISATDNTGKSEQAKKLAEKILSANALIIVAPEYNHGYPGELKMMLDLLYKEYFGKPVGLCGVSVGPFGGVRMIEQLKLVCNELRMPVTRDSIYFSGVQNLFDEQGNIKDESYSKRIEAFLTELVNYVNKLS